MGNSSSTPGDAQPAAAAAQPAAAAAAAPAHVVFNVGMTCDGCAGAVKRVLGKIDGVREVVTDVPAKRVTVSGSADAQVMLAALKTWGAAAGKCVELAA